MSSLFSPTALWWWVGAYFLICSVQTFDKRINQRKLRGEDTFELPAIMGLVYWFPWPMLVCIAIIDWKVAIGVYIAGFVLAVMPVLDNVGFVIMCALMPRVLFRRK